MSILFTDGTCIMIESTFQYEFKEMCITNSLAPYEMEHLGVITMAERTKLDQKAQSRIDARTFHRDHQDYLRLKARFEDGAK